MSIYFVVGELHSIRYIGDIIKSKNTYPIYKNIRAKNKSEALYLLMDEMYNYVVAHCTSMPMYYFENINVQEII